MTYTTARKTIYNKQHAVSASVQVIVNNYDSIRPKIFGRLHDGVRDIVCQTARQIKGQWLTVQLKNQ